MISYGTYVRRDGQEVGWQRDDSQTDPDLALRFESFPARCGCFPTDTWQREWTCPHGARWTRGVMEPYGRPDDEGEKVPDDDAVDKWAGAREALAAAESPMEAIYLALGMASMCWVPRPGDQVFQSEEADAIGKALMARLDLGERHDEGTLQKVHRALEGVGLTEVQVTDAIFQMQNEGILFRERQ